jgi:hypothetical protein
MPSKDHEESMEVDPQVEEDDEPVNPPENGVTATSPILFHTSSLI